MTSPNYLKGVCPVCGRPGVVPAAARFGFRPVLFRCVHCAARLEAYANKRSLWAVAIVVSGLIALLCCTLVAINRDWNGLAATITLSSIGVVTWVIAYRTVIHNISLRPRR